MATSLSKRPRARKIEDQHNIIISILVHAVDFFATARRPVIFVRVRPAKRINTCTNQVARIYNLFFFFFQLFGYLEFVIYPASGNSLLLNNCNVDSSKNFERDIHRINIGSLFAIF